MHPIYVSVFLCNAFSNMVLACLLEPLRVVRDQTGADIRWNILTDGDRTVSSSSGLSVSPEMPIADALEPDLVIIIGGDEFRNTKGVTSARSFGRLMQGATVIAADTGAWILARGGFLNARNATLHWQLLEEFAEEFPKVEVLPDRHVQDGQFWTCGSAAAAFDLMLKFVRERFGASVSFDAGAMFIHDTPDGTVPHIPIRHCRKRCPRSSNVSLCSCPKRSKQHSLSPPWRNRHIYPNDPCAVCSGQNCRRRLGDTTCCFAWPAPASCLDIATSHSIKSLCVAVLRVRPP